MGGIGSYPVLGNPHYHRFTDRLETINQQLVAEVSKTTVATLMLLAHVPARLKDVRAEARGDATEVSFEPAPEADVREYVVTWETEAGTAEERIAAAQGGERVMIRLPRLPEGTAVHVTAVNAAGMEGWDRARAVVRG